MSVLLTTTVTTMLEVFFAGMLGGIVLGAGMTFKFYASKKGAK
jgi:hypothetical protein